MTSVESRSHMKPQSSPDSALAFRCVPALDSNVASAQRVSLEQLVNCAHHLLLLNLYGLLEERIPAITTDSQEQRAEDKDCGKPHGAAEL